MTEVQETLTILHNRGWTIPAIADELGMSASAVEKWKAGVRTPNGQKMVLTALGELIRRNKLPKRRRYIPKEAS